MAAELGRIPSERNPTLLADWTNTDGQTANTSWNSDPYKPEASEVAEVTYLEIFSPVTTDGTGMDLKRVVPVIDGIPLEEQVELSGKYGSVMMPPHVNMASGPSPLLGERRIVTFGTPMERNPLLNTTLKVKDSLAVRTVAGAGGVTANYRIKVWGYLYRREEELREIFGPSLYGRGRLGIGKLTDMNRGVDVNVIKSEIGVSIANWDALSGGVRQARPEVYPFIRYAYNAKDTTANANYEFSFLEGEVASTWENMFFDFGEKDALLIKGIGVKPVAHLKTLGVKLGSDEYPRPKCFDVSGDSNPFNFGLADPLFPADVPMFLPIATLPYGYLVHNIKGRVFVKDDGTPIAADDITAAMYGIRVMF